MRMVQQSIVLESTTDLQQGQSNPNTTIKHMKLTIMHSIGKGLSFYLFDCYSGCNRCYKRDEKRPIMVHTRFAFFRREFYIYISDLFLRDKITQELFVLCCLYMHRSVVPDIPPYNPLVVKLMSSVV
jgi:hypothetical protein